MKQSIEWHGECLVNMRSTLRRYEEADRRARERTEKLQADIEFYEQQMAVARERGMADFDRERLLYRKAVKSN